MKKPKNLIYCADFETTSNNQYQVEGETKVYLWRILGVDNLIDQIGISMDSFMSFIAGLGDGVIYFHNLSFDGEFIIWHLLENNYTYDEELKAVNTFRSIIDETGSIYSISVKHSNNAVTEFRCSY